jgi:endonuclease/exonuclease/phosphatase (EEP) superfamily protein YafD
MTQSSKSVELDPTPPAAWLPRRLHSLFMAALFLVVLFSLARFGARWSPLCELFSHFAMQYGLILLLGAAYLFARTRPRKALIALAFAGLNLSLVLPFAIPKKLLPAPSDAIPIASVNVLIKNRDYRQTLSFVEAANPDILIVSEVDDEWLHALDALNYPHSNKFPMFDWLGLAIYSRFEIISHETFPAKSPDPYACAWTLKVKDRELVVIGAHPEPPRLPPNGDRKKVLDEMTKFVAKFSKDKPTVLIGDLNVTPWSPYFESLANGASLTDARIGQGALHTWPTTNPLLWIPIDHCLVSKQVQLHGFYTAPSVNSDHFPILCRISLK